MDYVQKYEDVSASIAFQNGTSSDNVSWTLGASNAVTAAFPSSETATELAAYNGSGSAAATYSDVYTIASGAQSMASGASALNSETNSLDVQAEIDSLLADIGGSMEAPESFADGRNGTVTAVQFVIQTEAIEVPADDAGPEPAAEEQSFWDKLLALFGL